MKTASVIALALIATVALVAQSPMRPGLWEITTQMQMPNMPAQVQMPEMKVPQCITPEQAKDPVTPCRADHNRAAAHAKMTARLPTTKCQATRPPGR